MNHRRGQHHPVSLLNHLRDPTQMRPPAPLEQCTREPAYGLIALALALGFASEDPLHGGGRQPETACESAHAFLALASPTLYPQVRLDKFFSVLLRP